MAGKIVQLLEVADVRMPLRLCDEEAGVVLDADGRDVLVVDVNGERPDLQAHAIATILVEALNALADRPDDLVGKINRLAGGAA